MFYRETNQLLKYQVGSYFQDYLGTLSLSKIVILDENIKTVETV